MDPFKTLVIGTPPSRTFTGDATGLLTAANNLSDVADGATARTSLGLGTMATQAASNVAITGGTGAFTTVGIGTVSPAQKFDLRDGVGVFAPTAQTAAIADALIVGQNFSGTPDTGRGARIYLGSAVNTSRMAAIEAAVSSGINGHHLAFLTQVAGSAPSERMRIDSAGRLGIGTTSPVALLQVDEAGSGSRALARFTARDGATNHRLEINVNDTDKLVQLSSTGSSVGGFTFFTGGNERVRIASSGTLRFNAYGAGILTTDSSGNVTAGVSLLASTTGLASLRIPHGTAPTSPVDGDIWTTSAGMFVRINGVTREIAFV
jgi:hypothetical protein